ncbi:MAG: hypothetical protein V4671_28225 [Armatimonadota bacterium]
MTDELTVPAPRLVRPENGFAEYFDTHPGGQVIAALLSGDAWVYRQVQEANLPPAYFPFDFAEPLAHALIADEPFMTEALAGRVGPAEVIDQLDRLSLYAGETEGDQYLLEAGESGVFWMQYSLAAIGFIVQKRASATPEALAIHIEYLQRLRAADISVDLWNVLTELDEAEPGVWVPYSFVRNALTEKGWNDHQIIAEMKEKLASGVLVKRQENKISYWRLAEISEPEENEAAQ